ncbi:MAG: Phosphoribosyl-ATP pyrophosphatase [Actinobacteria bacterium ADurb.Bin346]|nr:MAG: Phosphoribosyl-ATP pyrophosphatase [Actinobacteria bacterium ADurb.Bin346]
MENENLFLIPAIIQDYNSGQVLMFAYMTKQSLKKTLETGTTWFYSRSRQKLWNKGETSGNIQEVKEISFDCDMDTVLIKVIQNGYACHTGSRSCFFNKMDITGKEKFFRIINKLNFTQASAASASDIIGELYDVINQRIREKKENSYTFSLHKKGLDEILKKLGEESIEVILASKHQSKKQIVYEVADLLYHLLVLLAEKKITIGEIYDELDSRRK